MSDSLLQSRDGGVLTLTLNRPDLHNAFDDALVAALDAALTEAAEDATLRALVITGAGRSFSAGADLNWMQRMADAGRDENEADALRLAELMSRLNYFPVPTIAKVNGAAFGGGLGLVACCDIAIAAEDAKFGLTEARLGLAPAVISPYVFRRIGFAQSRRWFLSAERFDAATARDIGLVHEVVDADALDNAVAAQVRHVLANGPSAVRVAKQLLFAVGGTDLQRQARLDVHTAKLIAELRVSAEGQEGLKAFLEKRKPSWSSDGDD